MLTRWILMAASGLGLAAGASMGVGTAQAAPYGAAGCGLGSLVFHDDPGFIQVIAATLNSTGVQTFGITSGTSNCSGKMDKGDKMEKGGGKKGKGKKDKDKDKGDDAGDKGADAQTVNDFIVANMATLKVDTARGEGETLTALATLLGCDGDATTVRSFGNMTQAKHAELDAQSDAAAIQHVLVSGVQENSELSSRCGYTS